MCLTQSSPNPKMSANVSPGWAWLANNIFSFHSIFSGFLLTSIPSYTHGYVYVENAPSLIGVDMPALPPVMLWWSRVYCWCQDHLLIHRVTRDICLSQISCAVFVLSLKISRYWFRSTCLCLWRSSFLECFTVNFMESNWIEGKQYGSASN